ncbi:Uncharacterised protein [Bacillus tequilensis]|nr:Uncharacterised protein [Bacillus tequilensis]
MKEVAKKYDIRTESICEWRALHDIVGAESETLKTPY